MPLLRDSSDGHNRDDIPSKPERKETETDVQTKADASTNVLWRKEHLHLVVLECNFEALCYFIVTYCPFLLQILLRKYDIDGDS